MSCVGKFCIDKPPAIGYNSDGSEKGQTICTACAYKKLGMDKYPEMC